MRLTFLGTGTSQGIPVIGCDCETCTSSNPHDRRLRCSVYIESDDLQFVIDTGPDFRQQMLDNNIREVDYILYTHEHADHTAGIDDIRPFNFKSKKPMEVYGMERTLNDIKARFSYIFKENPYPGAPRVNLNPIDSPFELMGQEIIPVEVSHGKMQIYGYKIGGVAYLTDISAISQEELTKVQGIDTLIISALHHMPHHSHLNFNQALAVIKQIKPKRAYLIHMSHFMGPEKEWTQRLPANVYAAYDGLSIEIGE